MAETEKFKRWAERVVIAARSMAWEVVRLEANNLARQIGALAPRKTGRLAQSVRTEEDERAGVVRIKAGGPATTVPVRQGQTAKYDYALAQEFGTQKQPAAPFFYPTWRRGRQRARKNINKAIIEAIEKTE